MSEWFSNHALLVIIALELGYLILAFEYGSNKSKKQIAAWGQIIQEEIRAVQRAVSEAEEKLLKSFGNREDDDRIRQ